MMTDRHQPQIDRPTFVTHLECSMTGERHEADRLHNLSRAGKPLLVRYDLAAAARALTKEALAQRPADLWRYRELLPGRRGGERVFGGGGPPPPRAPAAPAGGG